MRLIPGSLFAVICLLSSFHLQAQLVGEMDDESKLYAQTKQVNQFFRRFNGEEDEQGNRYYESDKEYRNAKLRKKYLRILFDEQNSGVSENIKVEFLKDILDKDKPKFINFHNNAWFAEVVTTFNFKGKDRTVTLILELEKQHLGRKWVISKVNSDIFKPYFERDTSKVGKFLHPMSHELYFMNLRKAMEHKDMVNQFANREFEPDHLSLFLYEVKNGNLKFKTVNQVHFHIFQIDEWYFEVSEFNRPSYNTGWLISNLVRTNQEEAQLLKKYILNGK